MKEQLGQPCSQPGPEHEMLHQKLRAALKELGQRAGPFERLEHIVLVHPRPGQGEPLLGEPVALMGQFLLRLEEIPAGGHPVRM
jgi:hypothetical protein